MKKSTKAMIISAAVSAVSATVLVTLQQLTARGFMKIAMDRQEPELLARNRTKLMGSDELMKCVEMLTQGAENLTKKETQTIQITAHDGISLTGHWYPCENAKRVIVAMHGWRSSWARDFGIIADFLHKEGCSVLFAEQRGQGASGGDYMGFGILERYDCFEWAKWADAHTESKLPLYLIGVSMGATTVMMTTGFDLPASVCGVVADCGFTSPYDIWRHVVQNNLRIPFGIYKSIANDIFKEKLRVSANDYSCADALCNTTVPVLFVHGTDDRFVPVTMTFQNYKACTGEKELFVVPGADHGMSYMVDRKGYEAKLSQFFAKHDSKVSHHEQ